MGPNPLGGANSRHRRYGILVITGVIKYKQVIKK